MNNLEKYFRGKILAPAFFKSNEAVLELKETVFGLFEIAVASSHSSGIIYHYENEGRHIVKILRVLYERETHNHPGQVLQFEALKGAFFADYLKRAMPNS